MPTYGMAVEDLGTCVRLIDIMQRNLPALGIDRSKFDAVYVEDKTSQGPAVMQGVLGRGAMAAGSPIRRLYTVIIEDVPDDLVKDLERLAGSRMQDVGTAKPAGDSLTINMLLDSTLLIREPRPAAENGLIVALVGSSATGIDLAAWRRELGRLGCRGIRIGFLKPQQGANMSVLCLIEIARPPPNFAPPDEWTARRALTFCRLRREASCPFFVEWGYAHPVRELSRLYRIVDERVVLMAADALERQRGQGVRSQTRVSMKLRDSDWRSVFEMPDQVEYAIESAMHYDWRTLSAATETQHVTIAVEVRNESTLGSSAADVESKIAWHQQAIEQLRRTRQRHQVEREEPVYLVQVFEQFLGPAENGRDVGGDTPIPSHPLPAGFVRFLDRPYTELTNLRYGFYQDPANPDVGLHLVLDERPGSYDRVWTDLASDSYVATQQWWDMGVRLFVRAGDALYPNIEDEALLLRLRDELWRHESLDHDQPLLLRRRHSSERGPYVEAISLKGLRPLLDPGVFRMLGERFDVRIPEFHFGTREDMIEAQRKGALKLNELADELESGIVAAIEDRVSDAENKWRETDGRVDATELRLEAHLESAAQINSLLDDHTRAWESFVDGVLEADGALSHRKVEALSQYQTEHASRAEAIGNYRVGLLNVNEQLEADLRALTSHRTTITEEESRFSKLERDVPAEIATVDRECDALRDKIAILTARQTQELEATRKQIAARESELVELEKKQREAVELNARLGDVVRTAEAVATSLTATATARVTLLGPLSDACNALDGVLKADSAVLDLERRFQVDRIGKFSEEIKKIAETRIALAHVASRVDRAGMPTPPLGGVISPELLKQILERLP